VWGLWGGWALGGRLAGAWQTLQSAWSADPRPKTNAAEFHGAK
jgi:hypothetical protein